MLHKLVIILLKIPPFSTSHSLALVVDSTDGYFALMFLFDQHPCLTQNTQLITQETVQASLCCNLHTTVVILSHRIYRSDSIDVII